MKFLSRAIVLSLALLSSEVSLADELPLFEYGRSCAQLNQLTSLEVMSVTHESYSENFRIFCRTDSVYSCKDYEAMLSEVGTLEDSGNGICRYLPIENR